MPTFRYAGETPRVYPYPPIARKLEPGDTVELDADQVPVDGRFLDASGAIMRPPVPVPADDTDKPTPAANTPPATMPTAGRAAVDAPTSTTPARAAGTVPAPATASTTTTAATPAAAAADDKDA